VTHVFHRDPRNRYPVAVRGDGAYLVDADGKRYLDASGGAAVSCLGHSDRAVIEAIQRQLDVLPYAHTSFFSNEPMERLADVLVERSAGAFGKVYFVSGGSEAIEAALKLARQYFVERGEAQRRYVIARTQSYHGNTLGALAVGGNPARRRQFEPLLIEATHVSPCYAYRGLQPGESEAAYGERLAQELEREIRRLDGDKVMAFVAETVSGATLGAVPPVPGYFRRVREVCDRYGVLLILDEVMCGMGRCGSLFAYERESIVPDLVTVAKGLGAGYQPIGAVLVQGRIVEALRAGSGLFQHGHTYLGHSVACAAALAVQQVIERDGLLDAVRRQGAGLRERLDAAFGAHPHVGDIRGLGLLRAVEFVADRASRAPFERSERVTERVLAAAFERGLTVYPCTSAVDGRIGDAVLLGPPLSVTDADLDEMLEGLVGAIRDVLG